MKTNKKQILDKITKLVGYEFVNKKRSPRYIHARSLFFKCMRIELNCTFQEIADFMVEQGAYFEHSNVQYSINRIDLYRQASNDIDVIYTNLYPKENPIFSKQREKVEIFKDELVELKINNDFTEILNSVPSNRMPEVKEYLSMLVKSWDWKAKVLPNACRTYDCGMITGA